jgi:hypothetical protein
VFIKKGYVKNSCISWQSYPEKKIKELYLFLKGYRFDTERYISQQWRIKFTMVASTSQVEFKPLAKYKAKVCLRPEWPLLKSVASKMEGDDVVVQAIRVINDGNYKGEWYMSLEGDYPVSWIPSGDLTYIELLEAQ